MSVGREGPDPAEKVVGFALIAIPVIGIREPTGGFRAGSVSLCPLAPLHFA